MDWSSGWWWRIAVRSCGDTALDWWKNVGDGDVKSGRSRTGVDCVVDWQCISLLVCDAIQTLGVDKEARPYR